MTTIPNVISAHYVNGYTLELSFDDGVKAEIDFSGWIEKFPFFAPLKNIDYFKNFFIDGGTVTWENGADIAPETLHEIALQNQEMKVA